ncbi:tetratricopeptide repeat protein [Uliginosibacterium sp. H3]|uniref:Tetratricopeptide repeat protein n=1 Tax=Uliginosibacterium silvisoli TaxID=3114758 RepID=A0ABU6K193_9RHOO|nr:tetratricopeptide repeat protein [Uliginosibacterium sp. H3]
MSTANIEQQAFDAWDKGELAQAFDLFSQAVALGLDGCMINLGYFHDEGIGTVQDKEKAMYWYKRAYRKGDSAAASNIAILYRERLRFRQSFQWFERAAEMGDGDAALELAKLYLTGTGVRRSSSGAVRCLQNALSSTHITEAGREEARGLLDEKIAL